MAERRLSTEPLLVVEKYEAFLNYFYRVAQNMPRQHGVVREMFLRDMLGQVSLFNEAGKSGQVSRLYVADAGLQTLRFWLRFLSHPDRKIITVKQHQVGSTMLAEVGRLLGGWMRKVQKPAKV
ncbi:MAG TPA: diversity-generating retroelement protein Avd [Acidimicrobiia bacterium]